jgi:hypothetical protein
MTFDSYPDLLRSVEPDTGKPRPGKYTFRLSLKTNGIERSLCEPTTRILRVDPRQLNFVVLYVITIQSPATNYKVKQFLLIPKFFSFPFFSMFPGKASVPAGCLWSLRVWLRVNGVDHRLFGEDELWVAKDPDFNAVGDASFARLRNLDGGEQVYHGYVGKALVTFTIRYVHIIFTPSYLKASGTQRNCLCVFLYIDGSV